jgi:hypothetical protein
MRLTQERERPLRAFVDTHVQDIIPVLLARSIFAMSLSLIGSRQSG